jgi:hypothetical protein
VGGFNIACSNSALTMGGVAGSGGEGAIGAAGQTGAAGQQQDASGSSGGFGGTVDSSDGGAETAGSGDAPGGASGGSTGGQGGVEIDGGAGTPGAAGAAGGVCVGATCVTTPKTVFLTSSEFVGGALGGLAGADANCQQLARAANLAGAYLAWLSDSTGSPAARFPKDVGPYRLVDGTIVANNWTELTSGKLRHAVDLTEANHTTLTVGNACAAGVWTDTTELGTLSDPSHSCGNWSDQTLQSAQLGSSDMTAFWSDWCIAGGDACRSTAHLYCFEE